MKKKGQNIDVFQIIVILLVVIVLFLALQTKQLSDIKLNDCLHNFPELLEELPEELNLSQTNQFKVNSLCPAGTEEKQVICDCAKETKTLCMVYCFECVEVKK